MYSGVYRGTVLDTADAQGKGRVKVAVPAVAGSSVQWASVCYSCNCARGIRSGAVVMVAFEAGDASRPVVLGQID